MRTLFINACVRDCSRTHELAEHLLKHLNPEITELRLSAEDLHPLSNATLALRDELLCREEWDHPMLAYARQFAEADAIVIAAPYWDLSFPSLLKIYLEHITVGGITFRYVDGIPQGLCKAKQFFYITTAGGPIFADFGFSYVNTLCQSFYGIPSSVCFKAENLDVIGMDVQAIMENVKREITEYFSKK